MRIAVASGKGGTGKTTLSVALALTLAQNRRVCLLDCDVEEPNAHLFLSLPIEPRPATVPSFLFDREKCSGCGACARACRFNAIAALKSGPLFFPEMCHGCGGCLLACSEGAISETRRENGVLQEASGDNLRLIYGLLNVGEAMAAPLIRSVREAAADEELCIIDAPPGASCAMLAAVADCDYVIMVTEPTPFGLHDLKLAVEALKECGLPHGVVVNRHEDGVSLIRDYCRESGVNLLLEIPHRREIAEGYSRGVPLTQSYPEVVPQLQGLFSRLCAQGGRC